MAYKISCQCNLVSLTLLNKPIVHAYCHCNDCRDLLDVPFHSVTAWKEADVSYDKGQASVSIYQHPSLAMQKHFCHSCGEVLFNTNSVNWRVVSQCLISKCNNGVLPEALKSTCHFFYEYRIIDIADTLPKYLRGTKGPLYDG